MGTTATPPFHAMSVDELEQTRTALEVKLARVDFETRGWILGYVNELITRARVGVDPAESG